MLRSLSLLLAIAFLLIPRLSQAQVALGPSTPSPAPAPAKVDPATEKKALDLVESLSEQVSNLHSPSNRMRAQCMVADLLWSRDEKRARSLFTAAVNQLAGRIEEIDYSDPEVYQDLNRLSVSRQELVMRIAAHDPDLAITALLKTRFQTDNNTLSRGGWNPQAEAKSGNECCRPDRRQRSGGGAEAGSQQFGARGFLECDLLSPTALSKGSKGGSGVVSGNRDTN
jgi:hypothetical protein